MPARHTLLPLLALAIIAFTVPAGKLGDLGAYLGVSLIVIGSAFLMTEDRAIRLIGLGACWFILGSSATYLVLPKAASVANLFGYVFVAIACALITRRRVAWFQLSAGLETAALAAISAMAVLTANNAYTEEGTRLLPQTLPFVGAIAFTIGVLGRSKSKTLGAFRIALGLAIVFELLDSSLPPEHYNRIWALPYLPVLYGIGHASKNPVTETPPVPARGSFGIRQQIVAAVVQVLPIALIITSISLAGGKRIIELCIIGMVAVTLIAARYWLLGRQRDWSYRQEIQLQKYSEEVISLDKPRMLNSLTVATLYDLIDQNGKVYIVRTVSKRVEVLAESGDGVRTSSFSRKPLCYGEPVHLLAEINPRLPKGTWIVVEVPDPYDTTADSTYLLCASAKKFPRDIEDHVRTVAYHYSLAQNTQELTAQVQQERASSKFNALAQDANDIVLLVDRASFEVDFVGANVERILNHPQSYYLGSRLGDHVHAQDEAAATQRLVDATKGLLRQPLDVQIPTRGGTLRWFEMSVRDLKYMDQVDALLVSFSDIHDRKISGMALRRSEARLRTFVQNSSDVSMMITDDSTIDFISPNVESIFGFEPDSMVGSPLVGYASETSHQTIMDLIDQAKETTYPIRGEVQLRSFRGSEQPTAEILISKYDLEQDTGFIAILHDITDRRQLEESLRSRALYDELTGLLNRPSFVHKTQSKIQGLGDEKAIAVAVMNLRNFKAINDSLNFSAGDEILAEVGARLQSTLRKQDIIARLSADEFAIAVTVEKNKPMVGLAERLVSIFADPFVLAGREVTIKAALGITTTAERRTSPNKLLQQAVIAMHESRSQSTTSTMFKQSMQDQTAERFQLALDLSNANLDQEFALVYQPLIAFKNNHVVSFEALLRWNHPEHGNISPGVFIPLAEANGMIIELGRWVMGEACRQLQRWKDIHPEFDTTSVGVNLSPLQLEQDGELERLITIVDDAGIDPAALTVELTESTMIKNAEQMSSHLSRLRAMNINIAIDDFGTGASGLSHLRELPVDVVKIDKSYVDKVGISDEGTALVHQIVDLAKAMGAKIVAEGIENPNQADYLREMGCDLGQGFYLARPMSNDKIVAWVQRHNAGRYDFEPQN